MCNISAKGKSSYLAKIKQVSIFTILMSVLLFCGVVFSYKANSQSTVTSGSGQEADLDSAANDVDSVKFDQDVNNQETQTKTGIMPGVKVSSICETENSSDICLDRYSYPFKVEVDIKYPEGGEILVVPGPASLQLPRIAGDYYDSEGNEITDLEAVIHQGDGMKAKYENGFVYKNKPIIRLNPSAELLQQKGEPNVMSLQRTFEQTDLPTVCESMIQEIVVQAEVDGEMQEQILQIYPKVPATSNGEPVYLFENVGGVCKKIYIDVNGDQVMTAPNTTGQSDGSPKIRGSQNPDGTIVLRERGNYSVQYERDCGCQSPDGNLYTTGGNIISPGGDSVEYIEADSEESEYTQGNIVDTTGFDCMKGGESVRYPKAGLPIIGPECEFMTDSCGQIMRAGEEFLIPKLELDSNGSPIAYNSPTDQDTLDLSKCEPVKIFPQNDPDYEPVASVAGVGEPVEIEINLFLRRFARQIGFDAKEYDANSASSSVVNAMLANPTAEKTMTLLDSSWSPNSNLYKLNIEVIEEGPYGCVYASFEGSDVSWKVNKDSFPQQSDDIFSQRQFDNGAQGLLYGSFAVPRTKYCFELPARRFIEQTPLTMGFLDESCTGFEGSVESNWNAPIVSVAATCVYNSMLNIFILNNNFGQDEDSGEYNSTFFEHSQFLFRSAIFGIFTIYIILFGYRLIMNSEVPKQSEWIWTALKLAIVMFFAIGDGVQYIFPKLLDITTGLSAMYIVAISSTGISDYDYCNFDINSYNNQISFIWDFIDCKMSKYIGLYNNENDMTTPYLLSLGPLVFFISFISYLAFFAIILLSILVVVSIVALVARVAYIYFLSVVALAILFFVFPLIVLASLFEVTKDFFDRWLQLVIAFVIQPVLLFAFLGLLFLLMDYFYFGDNKNFTTLQNPPQHGSFITYSISNAGSFAENINENEPDDEVDANLQTINYYISSKNNPNQPAENLNECVDPKALACIIQTLNVQTAKVKFFVLEFTVRYTGIDMDTSISLLLALCIFVLILFIVNSNLVLIIKITDRLVNLLSLTLSDTSPTYGPQQILGTLESLTGSAAGAAQSVFKPKKKGISADKIKKRGGIITSSPIIKGKKSNEDSQSNQDKDSQDRKSNKVSKKNTQHDRTS